MNNKEYNSRENQQKLINEERQKQKQKSYERSEKLKILQKELERQNSILESMESNIEDVRHFIKDIELDIEKNKKWYEGED